jgi:ABC-type nitrate/sulfonate/bicarbonate transport system permease component
MQIRSSALTGWLDRLARSWVSLAFAVGFVALWGALIRGFEVLRYIVPAPSAIFYQFWRNLPRIWE